MSLPISLCAFVKNEEHTLEGMVRSVRSHVQEVVITDTGSSDRTPEIAKCLASIYSEQPIDGLVKHYGEMRTFAFKQATQPWILMLDADERILKEDLYMLKGLIEQHTHDAWYLPRHQWDNLEMAPNREDIVIVEKRVYPDWQARLFRNNQGIHFVNKVHESIAGHTSIAKSPIGPHIQHFHYHFKSYEKQTEIQTHYRDIQEC